MTTNKIAEIKSRQKTFPHIPIPGDISQHQERDILLPLDIIRLDLDVENRLGTCGCYDDIVCGLLNVCPSVQLSAGVALQGGQGEAQGGEEEEEDKMLQSRRHLESLYIWEIGLIEQCAEIVRIILKKKGHEYLTGHFVSDSKYSYL